MKKFYLVMIFTATLIGGIGLSHSFDIRGRIDNYIHRDCARWGEETREQSLFTFEELKPILGKKVLYKNSQTGKDEIGRVISIMPIRSFGFMATIYFGNGTDDKNSELLIFGKENFYKNFEVLD